MGQLWKVLGIRLSDNKEGQYPKPLTLNSKESELMKHQVQRQIVDKVVSVRLRASWDDWAKELPV